LAGNIFGGKYFWRERRRQTTDDRRQTPDVTPSRVLGQLKKKSFLEKIFDEKKKVVKLQ